MPERHPESQARMIDVTAKEVTVREATAACRVQMSRETLEVISDGRIEKGDVLEVARLAGIMAAKRTPDLIPLCHPIPVTGVEVRLALSDDSVEVEATVRTADRTGVEMEALTAVTVAALTVYDMVKGIERAATIQDVRLLSKSGGRSGDWEASSPRPPSGV
jgi:cyclic pyranopterin phosphate synthase